MMKLDTSVTIAGVCFKNPVIAASGTFGFGDEYQSIVDPSLLGGICTKALTLRPRAGNKGIRIHETAAGLLNSIGLENPGIAWFLQDKLPALKNRGTVIIANLAGADVDEYVYGAALLSDSDVDMVELNISCPNVKSGGLSFGLDPEPAAALTRAVRAVCKKPLIVKISPNAPSPNAVALACINAGADCISLVNTFKAMAIDIHTGAPVFENITAGLSGPAIKPIALRMVWELCEILKQKSINVPVIGIGGIASAQDAKEFLIAGACAVQAGTATLSSPRAMLEIISGLETLD
ncbi:MAG: dihydroorotate dehydrogenase [Spirochaetaceae bacterium]|jgi:dihydroorotate dehydrogenase (NAD+) catalytic subunit|nr:dihydroorotate dehydrogenase [Spirochaetaceae bacterium]